MPLDNPPALSREDASPCCCDCAAADALLGGPMFGMDFLSARICTATCRQEQLRLPGAPLGLVQAGYMRVSEAGDFEVHHDWLDVHVPWREGDGD